MTLDEALNSYKEITGKHHGIRRIQKLCSDLSFYSLKEFTSKNEVSLNDSCIDRLQFVSNEDVRLPNDIVCAYLLFDAIKLDIIDRDTIYKALIQCSGDIITVDRIIYFSICMSNVKEITSNNNDGLVQAKSLSILYELDLGIVNQPAFKKSEYYQSVRDYLYSLKDVSYDSHTSRLFEFMYK